MALLDLCLVTQALIRVVKAYVSESGVWTGAGTGSGEWELVPVSPLPPDQLTPPPTQMAIHLYHVSEEAHFKNQAIPGSGETPVRCSPIGLNLYYQLTVAAESDETSQYQAQLLMGVAVKALHDYPNLTDETEVNGHGVFQALDGLANADNRIRLSLQPVDHTEAAGFWTAGSSALRLSAYYQASVILLEPEEPSTRATRVLHYGVQTFVTGAPRLDGSENTVTFSVPDVSEPQELRLRPAEVPAGGRVTFTGVDLSGDETRLLLRSAHWTEPRQVDEAWGVVVSPNQVLAVIGETLGGEAVLPGMYAASVRVVRRQSLPDGSVRVFEQRSNETPFAVAPRIDDPIEGPDADGVVTVRGHIFRQTADAAHPDRPVLDPAEDIQVYLGADCLRWRASGTPEPMEFIVADANTLRLRLPENLAAGDHMSLRLLINGAESAPRWIEVPA